MAETPLSFLISRAKWSKLYLLLKEIALTVGFRVGKLTGIGPLDIESSQTPIESTSAPGVDHTIAGKFPDTLAKQFDWTYESRVSVGVDVLSRSANKYHQDRHIGDG